MTTSERCGLGLVQFIAGLNEMMKSTMAAAFGCGPEVDALQIAYIDGYEIGFADALRIFTVAAGLAGCDHLPAAPGEASGPADLAHRTAEGQDGNTAKVLVPHQASS